MCLAALISTTGFKREIKSPKSIFNEVTDFFDYDYNCGYQSKTEKLLKVTYKKINTYFIFQVPIDPFTHLDAQLLEQRRGKGAHRGGRGSGVAGAAVKGHRLRAAVAGSVGVHGGSRGGWLAQCEGAVERACIGLFLQHLRDVNTRKMST